MRILIQSFLNAGKTISLEVDTDDDIENVKDKIADVEGISINIMELYFNEILLEDAQTVADYDIQTDSYIKTSNNISTLSTKEQKQIAKLNLAKAKKIIQGDPDHTYDLGQLPTKYIGNTVFDNPNLGGLVLGRPWASDRLVDNIETEDGFNILTEDNKIIALEIE